VCGNKGCGIKHHNHANTHAIIAGHRLGLELSSRSVYDLVSFRHIHSLSQPPIAYNPRLFSPDPQLSSSRKCDPEKFEEHEQITLLKTQLCSQRLYYETQLKILNDLCSEQSSQIAQVEVESRTLNESANGLVTGLSLLRRQAIDQNSEMQKLEAELLRQQNSIDYYQKSGDNLAVQLAKEKLELGQIELTIAELESTLSSRMRLLG